MGLSQLHSLCPDAQRQLCSQIIPPSLWEHLAQINPVWAHGPENPQALRIIVPTNLPELHLRCPASRLDNDFALCLDLEEIATGEIELGFIIINNLLSPRFNIDTDPQGRSTLLGTAQRNIDEELRALHAGLAPCQVRQGLDLFHELLPRLEAFALSLGYVCLCLEPLTYHNAIMYENHGFSYITGLSLMQTINHEFLPDGRLSRLLNPVQPFRQPSFATSVRGRSWAIHDQILADIDMSPSLELRMTKVLGTSNPQHTFFPNP